MKQIIESLRQWREERGLTTQSQEKGYCRNVLEELGELAEAWKNNDTNMMIDALCDITVFTFNAHDISELTLHKPIKFNIDLLNQEIGYIVYKLGKLLAYKSYDELEIKLVIDAINNVVYSLGYNYKNCMKETIKEISSRTGKFNPSIGKWVKDTSDEAKAKWYTANYDSCKIKDKG